MLSLKHAFLQAVKIFLDNSGLEVTALGPKGPVVIDKITGEQVIQSPPAAPETPVRGRR